MEIKQILILFFILILFNSCSSFKDKKDKIIKITTLYSNSSNNQKFEAIEESQIKNINYPLIQIKTNNVIRHAVMLPISYRNGHSNFISGNKQSLTLSGTLISKTNGFNANLISVEFDNSSPFFQKQNINTWSKINKRSYSFVTPTHKVKKLNFECKLLFGEKEKILILKNKEKLLTKIKENCKSKKIDFQNTYWAEENGFVWKSKQWVSEKMIYIDMIVLKL